MPGAELCIPRSAVPRSTVAPEIVLKKVFMIKWISRVVWRNCQSRLGCGSLLWSTIWHTLRLNTYAQTLTVWKHCNTRGSWLQEKLSQLSWEAQYRSKHWTARGKRTNGGIHHYPPVQVVSQWLKNDASGVIQCKKMLLGPNCVTDTTTMLQHFLYRRYIAENMHSRSEMISLDYRLWSVMLTLYTR